MNYSACPGRPRRAIPFRMSNAQDAAHSRTATKNRAITYHGPQRHFTPSGKIIFDGTKLPAVYGLPKTTGDCISCSFPGQSTSQNRSARSQQRRTKTSGILPLRQHSGLRLNHSNFRSRMTQKPRHHFPPTLLTGTKSRIFSCHRVQGSPLPKEV